VSVNFYILFNQIITRLFTQNNLLFFHDTIKKKAIKVNVYFYDTKLYILFLIKYKYTRNIVDFFQKYLFYIKQQSLYIIDWIYLLTLPPIDNEMIAKKASNWVDKYTAIVTLLVFCVYNIPGAATGIIVVVEIIMFHHIGNILYKEEWNWDGIWKVAYSILIKIIGIPIIIGNITALEASIIAGHEAFAIKPAIAASMVRTTGILLFRILEEISRAKTNGRSIIFSK
jgi:hypothetical protein